MKEISVVCSRYSVEKANGYAVAFELYKFLSRKHKINVIVPREVDIFSEEMRYINPNMTIRNVCIKAVQENHIDHWEIYKNLTENITQRDKEKLKNAISSSDIIICDSVYWVSLVKSIFPNRAVFFRSLDIEYDKILYMGKYLGTDISTLKRSSYGFERKAYKDADVIFTLTQDDANRAADLYQIDRGKFKVLPICSPNIDMISRYVPDKRVKGAVTKGILISAAEINDSKVLLAKIEKIKNFEFHIVGRACSYLENVPSNVILHGAVSEEEKNRLLAVCDFALNITKATYGMNVKISDYFLSGIPVLSNKLGVRGYNVQENVHYFPCVLETLDSDIIRFCNTDSEERYKIALTAFKNYCNYNNYNNYCKYLPLEDVDEDECSFFIFGAGICGEYALSELNTNGYNCIGFIDNDINRHGENYLGKAIYTFFEAMEVIRKSAKKIKIVIAVLSLTNLGEIYNQVSAYIGDEDILILESHFRSLISMDILDKNKFGTEKK